MSEDSRRREFQATWNIGKPLPQSAAGVSSEFFPHRTLLPLLVLSRPASIARASFTSRGRCEVRRLNSYQSTMIQSLGIAEFREGEPLLHYAESIAVDIWPLKKV